MFLNLSAPAMSLRANITSPAAAFVMPCIICQQETGYMPEQQPSLEVGILSEAVDDQFGRY